MENNKIIDFIKEHMYYDKSKSYHPYNLKHIVQRKIGIYSTEDDFISYMEKCDFKLNQRGNYNINFSITKLEKDELLVFECKRCHKWSTIEWNSKRKLATCPSCHYRKRVTTWRGI